MMYKTNSITLASYLMSRDGVKYVGVDKSDTSNIAFEFEPLELAEKFTDEYFSGGAIVNPLELFKNYRMLKDIVFEVKRNGPRGSGGRRYDD